MYLHLKSGAGFSAIMGMSLTWSLVIMAIKSNVSYVDVHLKVTVSLVFIPGAIGHLGE